MPRKPKAYQERHYAETARAYARDVIEGKEPASTWTRKACARFLADLERNRAKGSPYQWNPLLVDNEGFQYRPADRACGFIERLRHVKGPNAGEFIKLERWQVFIVANAFGWVKRGTRIRRFRIMYVEVPRGNGKSTMLAPIGLFMLCFDGEAGAEVYSAATTRDQARIVFDAALLMAFKSASLQERFGVVPSAKQIITQDWSKFVALSADAHSLDGLNVHCAIIDELHAHKTRDVYDVLETALGKRERPMLATITTAGGNKEGICYEVRAYLTQILDGTIEDDAFFGVIYCADEDDDIQDPAVWRKANPNWGVSVRPEHIEQLAKKARTTPSAAANFATKHLNRWVSSFSAWIDVSEVRPACVREWDDSEFAGKQDCVLALDLASRVDIAVLCRLWWREEPDAEGKPQWHVYIRNRYFVPESALEDEKRRHYRAWINSGLMETTPGKSIEFERIRDAIVADSKRLRVSECVYDPWQAHYLAETLRNKDGFAEDQVLEYRQTVANMSPAMKEMQSYLLGGRFHWSPRDKVFDWMLANVVAKEDAKDNIYPRRATQAQKIDGVVAAIMGIGRVMLKTAPGTSTSVYESRGIRSV